MFSKITLFLSLLSISFTISAQEVSVKRFEDQNVGTYTSHPIGVDSEGFIYNYDNIVLIGNKEDHYLRVLDPEDGKVISNSKIDKLEFFKELNLELIDESYESEEICLVQNGQLFLFAKGEQKGEQGVFILKLNHLLELEGKPFFISTKASNCIGNCKHVILENKLNHDSSEPSFISKVYSGKPKAEIAEFRLITLNDENEVLHENEIVFPKRKISDIDFVTLNGNTFMKVEAFTREPEEGNLLGFLFKENVYTNHLYVKDKKGALRELELDVFNDGLEFSDANIQQTKGNVIITGKLIEEDLFVGIGTIVIDGETLNQISKNVYDFDSGISDGYEDVRYDKRKRGLDSRDEIINGKFSDTYELVKQFMNKNGDLVNIYQNVYAYSMQSTSVYKYTNVLVVSIKPDGIIRNVTYLPIDQSDVNGDPEKGLSAFTDGNDLYIVHVSTPEITKTINEVNKNEKYQNLMNAEYLVGLTKIDQDGKVISHGLIDTRKEEIFYNARDVVADKNKKYFHIITTPQNSVLSKNLKMATIVIE